MTPTGGGGVRVAERDVLAYLAQLPKATPLAQKMAAEAGVDLRAGDRHGPRRPHHREDVTRTLQPAARLRRPPRRRRLHRRRRAAAPRPRSRRSASVPTCSSACR